MATDIESGSKAVTMFRQAMEHAGIMTMDEIVPTDRIRRFHVEGDRPGKKNGWYVLHLDPWPCGAFGSWKLAASHGWKLPGKDGLSREQRTEWKKRIKEAEAACRAQLEQECTKAREQAESIWQRAKPAPEDHPYLKKKRIVPNGTRLYDGKLVLPLRDAEGTLHSLQFISGAGDKLFLEGGRVAGCLYDLGSVKKRLYIAEGFATGATVHEVTSDAVAVAFNAGNLKPVAEALRKKYSRAEFVIVADNDQWTDENPGVTKALEAARAIKGKVAVPRFQKTGTQPTDVNDLFCLEGRDAVAEQLRSARAPEMWENIPGVLASDVRPEPIKWLWEKWVPRCEITMLDGDPGMGKSVITVDLAARVTKAWNMPDGSEAQLHPRGVVIISTEDTPSTTIVPRLKVAGADLRRVRIVTEITGKDGMIYSPELTRHELAIESALRDMDAALLIVDPLVASLDAKTDTHKDAEVRRNLTILKRLAVRTGVAVVGLRHFNKAGGGNPLYRGQGSIAFTGAARSVLLAAHDPDDPTQNVLAVAKSNLAVIPPSLRYHLGPPGETVRVTWEGESPRTAVDLLVDTGGEEERSKIQVAEVFVRTELSDGRMLTTEMTGKARQHGIADKTLQRARRRLGVVSYKDPKGPKGKWYLELPQSATQGATP
jgi:putative DNA primase/helicase